MSMNAEVGGGPSWLFSFVDLAFLMLIAMTQMRNDAVIPELGEIIVPSLRSEATNDLPGNAAARWQLRVHPPSDDEPAFDLQLSGGAVMATDAVRIDLATLEVRLSELIRDGGEKPLLAPHEDSRTQDLLDALDALEDHWPGRRRATIDRSLAQNEGA